MTRLDNPQTAVEARSGNVGGPASATRVAFSPATDDGVMRLRFVRDHGNAFDAQTIRQLASAAEQIVAAAPQARVLLIEADGRNFNVGGDLAYLNTQQAHLADELVLTGEPYHRALAALTELPVPVVCAAQGAVAGGGLGLLWCADIVIAAEDLKIVTAFSHLGVTGDGGSTWFLPRLVGLRRAQELFLENRPLSAHQSLEWGLVTRIVPPGRLAEEATATARRLAEGPTVGLGLQRRLLRDSFGRSLAEGYDAELIAMRSSGATADAAGGIAAFIERRTPRFRGA